MFYCEIFGVDVARVAMLGREEKNETNDTKYKMLR